MKVFGVAGHSCVGFGFGFERAELERVFGDLVGDEPFLVVGSLLVVEGHVEYFSFDSWVLFCGGERVPEVDVVALADYI